MARGAAAIIDTTSLEIRRISRIGPWRQMINTSAHGCLPVHRCASYIRHQRAVRCLGPTPGTVGIGAAQALVAAALVSTEPTTSDDPGVVEPVAATGKISVRLRSDDLGVALFSLRGADCSGK
jgi:hypothetical protein